MINKFIANGRTTRDVELRYTPSNVPVASFTLAVNRNFKNKDGEYEADFINCIAFRGTADLINKYVKKGDLIGIEGRLQTRSYEAQDGSKRYATEIIVENVDFLSSNSNSSTEPKTAQNEPGNVPQNYKTDYQDTVALKDEDLPF